MRRASHTDKIVSHPEVIAAGIALDDLGWNKTPWKFDIINNPVHAEALRKYEDAYASVRDRLYPGDELIRLQKEEAEANKFNMRLLYRDGVWVKNEYVDGEWTITGPYDS